MSIIITGMEMPTEREWVDVRIFRDGTAIVTGERAHREEHEAVFLKPHGRLIDADALITTFCEWGTSLENKGKFVITMAEAKQTIVDIIEDAPTIIPADKEGA